MNSLNKLATVAVFLLSSCSHKIEIITLPDGAQVYDITESGKKTLLGKTPITIDDKIDLDTRSLSFEVPGFETQQLRIVFPYQASSKIVMRMTPIDEDWYEKVLLENFPDRIDKAVLDILEFQNLLHENNENLIEEQFARLVDKYSKISIFQTLRGVHHFKAGRFAEAEQLFLDALKKNPANKTAQKMINLLKKNPS